MFNHQSYGLTVYVKFRNILAGPKQCVLGIISRSKDCVSCKKSKSSTVDEYGVGSGWISRNKEYLGREHFEDGVNGGLRYICNDKKKTKGLITYHKIGKS